MRPATLILLTAADVLSQPENWTQHTYARDDSGRGQLVYSPNASCWCAMGAIQAAAAELFGERVKDGAIPFIQPHFRAARDHWIRHSHAVFGLNPIDLNDGSTSTNEQVAAALYSAAEAYERENA